MYVIDILHYLDDRGAIAPQRGPAKKLAVFLTGDDVVVWQCPACGTQGRISNWQGTFWDLGQGLPAD